MKTYSEFITEARGRGSNINLAPLGKAVIKGTAKLAWKATKLGAKVAGKAIRDYGKTKPEGTKRRAVADALDKIAPKISPTVRRKREEQRRKSEQRERAAAREARAAAREARAEARERRAQETHERRMNRPTSSSRRPRTSSPPSGRYRNTGAGSRESIR